MAHLSGAPTVHPGSQAAGTGEVIRHTTHLGQRACQAPSHLSWSDLGRAQNTGPTKSVPLWGAQEPEPEGLSPGKCMQPRVYFRQFPAEQLEPEQCRLGKHTHSEWGQTQWSPDTEPPHTSQ